MTNPLIAIPDARGVIRVVCGGKEFEIQIAVPVGAGAGTAPIDLVPATPDPDLGSIFDKPGTYLRVDGTDKDRMTVARLVREMLENVDANELRAVVLTTDKLNFQEINQLRDQIAGLRSELPIAVDFGGLLKP
ncbi:MAG TPA: hypothetical protein VGV39_13850 [Mesorhizobium sp.]|uniref:hypothetical protein n=1 Tax=Mesorhizobium sp. TaxID=1871066 RepID=UPI002DDCA761|nr:hypothetical protein [Mesorhizobium sp.]HEV2504155.1 hypothetical protein [Mesorhizobium sp.]